jgi:hypothetical protein
MRPDDIGSLQVAEETVLIRIFVIAIVTLHAWRVERVRIVVACRKQQRRDLKGCVVTCYVSDETAVSCW